MRVGLIDVDGHNYPNLPLMKLSAWHKANGDSVEWYAPLFSGHMDRVYMSKIFSFTKDYPYYIDADEILRGAVDTAYPSRMAEKYLISQRIYSCLMRWNIFIQIMSYMELKIMHMDSLQGDAQEDAFSVTLKIKRAEDLTR